MSSTTAQSDSTAAAEAGAAKGVADANAAAVWQFFGAAAIGSLPLGFSAGMQFGGHQEQVSAIPIAAGGTLVGLSLIASNAGLSRGVRSDSATAYNVAYQQAYRNRLRERRTKAAASGALVGGVVGVVLYMLVPKGS